jgi:hypothetical protein
VALNLDRVGRIASNLAIQLGWSAANHPRQSATRCRARDPRQIDVAPHRGANHYQFPRLNELARRFVAFVFEFGHDE